MAVEIRELGRKMDEEAKRRRVRVTRGDSATWRWEMKTNESNGRTTGASQNEGRAGVLRGILTKEEVSEGVEWFEIECDGLTSKTWTVRGKCGIAAVTRAAQEITEECFAWMHENEWIDGEELEKVQEERRLTDWFPIERMEERGSGWAAAWIEMANHTDTGLGRAIVGGSKKTEQQRVWNQNYQDWYKQYKNHTRELREKATRAVAEALLMRGVPNTEKHMEKLELAVAEAEENQRKIAEIHEETRRCAGLTGVNNLGRALAGQYQKQSKAYWGYTAIMLAGTIAAGVAGWEILVRWPEWTSGGVKKADAGVVGLVPAFTVLAGWARKNARTAKRLMVIWEQRIAVAENLPLSRHLLGDERAGRELEAALGKLFEVVDPDKVKPAVSQDRSRG